MSESQKIGDDCNDVLRAYQTNEPDEFAHTLNRILRDRAELSALQRSQIASLDHAILRGKCIHPNLFRATCLSDIQPFIDQDVLVYPAFMSTSTARGLIRQHYPGGFTCNTPTRLAISGVLNANAFEYGGDECEVLIGRNARFRIIEQARIDDPRIIQVEFGPFQPPVPQFAMHFALEFEGYVQT